VTGGTRAQKSYPAFTQSECGTNYAILHRAGKPQRPAQGLDGEGRGMVNRGIPTVLLVEDNDIDALLVQRVWDEIGSGVRLERAATADAAVAYLGAAAGTPDHGGLRLVLLDIKLPGRTGLEVLDWLRAQAGLQALPAVMFTSSGEWRDVCAAYAHGANGYLVKPFGLDDLRGMLAGSLGFWVRVPLRHGGGHWSA